MPARLAQILGPALFLAAGMIGCYLIALAVDVDSAGTGFLLGFPFVAGMVILRYRPPGRFVGFLAAQLWIIGVMILTAALSLLLHIEGLLCITLALIPVFFAAMLGGFVYLLVLRWRAAGKERLHVSLLPALALVALNLLPVAPKTYEIADTILIDAPPETVFALLKSIPDIAPQELPTRFPNLLGIPKPTRAVWLERPEGPLRVSHWGAALSFHERITAVEPGRLIAWEFEFPPGWIAEGIEDPHIRVGGRYFNVLAGSYRLESLAGGTKTRLTLTSRTYDGTMLGPYAEFWHRAFFSSFHQSILGLVKTRIEAEVGAGAEAAQI